MRRKRRKQQSLGNPLVVCYYSVAASARRPALGIPSLTSSIMSPQIVGCGAATPAVVGVFWGMGRGAGFEQTAPIRHRSTGR